MLSMCVCTDRLGFGRGLGGLLKSSNSSSSSSSSSCLYLYFYLYFCVCFCADAPAGGTESVRGGVGSDSFVRVCMYMCVSFSLCE